MSLSGAGGAGKIAGAPISWGVCEVPGWGYQLSPERVLAEMTQVGLAATELGPAGFLPGEPDRAAHVLRQHHLASVGGFVPVVLHVPEHNPVPEVRNVLAGYAGTGSGTLVLSADSGQAGYDARPVLDEDGWATLLRNLDRLGALATEHGVLAVLHPHVGTMVENTADVQRVLDGSSISLCLDTGHLLIGGTDPAALARQVPGRIAHTHLKDVNDQIAAKVRSGRITYSEGVRDGMYRPLGTGDVDVEAIVAVLGRRGYDGWYVLEQDTILTGEPAGEGPVADVRTSAEYVRSVLSKARLAPGFSRGSGVAAGAELFGDAVHPGPDLRRIAPVTRFRLGHGTGRETLGARFEPAAERHVVPGVHPPHQRMDPLDLGDRPPAGRVVQRAAGKEVRRALPELPRVPPDEPAGLLVPPGHVQGAADDDGPVFVQRPYLARRQQIDGEAFLAQVVGYHGGQLLSAPACRTIGNQDSHRAPPFALPRNARRIGDDRADGHSLVAVPSKV